LGVYTIVGELGAGGMGQVYRARDSRLEREVALKLLPESLAGDAERRARFEREARALAALNHPHIVTIFGVDSIDGGDLIAMEVVEGETLEALLAKGRLPVARVLAIAVPIADAVAAAHRRGIVHRDLKPGNVMVGRHDRVKVLDFGLATERRRADDAAETALVSGHGTERGRILGTVSYMSPEQAEGRPVDERSDIFSFGVLLYEMATGDRPFKGESSLSILSAILRDVPRPMTDVDPTLPAALERIARRCLAKDPDARYQSAFDLRHDLEELRDLLAAGPDPGRSTRTATSAAAAPPAPRLRRAAVVAMAATVGGGLAWVAARSGLSTGEMPPTAASFHRLTLLEGVAQDSMISPDGKWVAYTSAVDGNRDIYLQSTTGQQAINLTKDSAAHDYHPAFSPDGERIAFRSDRDGGGLFVMGRTGDSVRRLTRGGFQPAWFPDGQRLVYASLDVSSPYARGGGLSELWTVDLGGGEPRRVLAGDAVQPRVSPDGRRIAFWAMPATADGRGFASADRDIWTVAADGSDPRRMTSGAATDWNPVWAPDGRWLYFLSNRAGTMNLWRVSADHSTGATPTPPVAVTVPAGQIRHFSLSQDGRIGAYATDDATSNVARIRFDSVAATTVGAAEPVTTGARDYFQFDLAADGATLVLRNSPRLNEDLLVMGVGAGRLTNVTDDTARDRGPRWSADGRSVLYYSDRGGAYDLWAIDRDGSGRRQLTRTGNRMAPVPSRDGTRVAAADLNTRRLFVYDASTLEVIDELPPFPDEFPSGRGGDQPSDWSPDGRQLAGFGYGVLWVYSFERRTYRLIGAGGGIAGVRWLPDGRRLIGSRGGRLIVIDSVTGESRAILEIPGELLAVPVLSRDGSMLYFLRTSVSGDVWVVRFADRTTEAPSGQ
jgi:serine/threonine protein kinase